MKTYTVTRSTTIEAPAERVQPLVADLRHWAEWSPWEDLDPQLRRTYTGPDSGPGQRYAWEGNRQAGRGTFDLVPEGDRTRVTWSMEGRQNALMALVGVFYPMDKMMGPDFEKGLARLGSAATRP